MFVDEVKASIYCVTDKHTKQFINAFRTEQQCTARTTGLV